MGVRVLEILEVLEIVEALCEENFRNGDHEIGAFAKRA